MRRLIPLLVALLCGAAFAQTATVGPQTINITTPTEKIAVTVPGGTYPATVTPITVPVAPTVALNAVPTTIASGTQAILTWTATNATACTGAGTGTTGSLTVKPTATTSYSETCTGTGGSATASATINVTTPPPPAVVIIGPNAVAGSPTSIADSAGASWTVASGVVMKAGQPVGLSSGVVLLIKDASGNFWQENNQCLFWEWNAVAATWGNDGIAKGPTGVVLPSCTPLTTGGGTPTPPPVNPVVCNGYTPTGVFGVAVCGKNFVSTKDGTIIQFLGVSVSGLEDYALQSWANGDDWGGQAPSFSALKTWGINAVRIPLNEASWVNESCVPTLGAATMKADLGGNYQTVVQNTVNAATAAGMYVSLDLHFTAPGNICPNQQQAMADVEHSAAFWTSVATAFKGYSNVMYEIFNEPFLDNFNIPGNNDQELVSGGGQVASVVFPNLGNVAYPWVTVGQQTLVNAIRNPPPAGAGATNVILSGSNAYDSDTGHWLANHPTDPLGQIAAVWHAYPNGAPGSSTYTLPNCVGTNTVCGPATMAAAQAIQAAGYPVAITEYGDTVTTAAWSQTLLPFADKNGMSYFGWTWDVWGTPTFDLITDHTGTPDGAYGAYVKQHYLCRAAGTANCP